MSTPDKHHQFGPSGLASYELCPRFEKREEGAGGAHPVAVEGTMLHAKVERRDLSNLTSEQVTMVENCLAYMDQHTEKCEQVLLEQMMDVCKRDDGSHVSFGTADVVALNATRAVGIDWKFGFNPVDHPSINLQGQCYACAIFDKYPEVETVEIHFYMARYGSGQSHVFTRDPDYDAIRLRIETVVARVAEEAEHTPSTKACLYCGAKGRCPAVAQHALSIANTQTDERLDLDSIEKIGTNELTDPKQMPKILRVAELLEPWCAEVKSKAKEMLSEGFPVEGYELRRRKGRQTTGNANAVFDAVKDEVTTDEFVEVCDVKLSALKKLVAEKAPRGSKGLAQELLVSKLKSVGLINETGFSEFLHKRKNF